MAQAGGLALTQGLFKVEPSFVVHVVVEVDVHPRGRVVDQKPARLGQGEALGVLVHQHRAYTQRCFHQHLYGVDRQAGLRGHFADGHALIAVAQQVENAQLQHQARSLEHNRSPGYPLCPCLSLAGRQVLFRICFL